MRVSYSSGNRRLYNRRRSSSNKRQLTYLFLAITIGLLMLWSIAGPYGYWKLQRMKQHRSTLVAKLADLSMKNTLIKKQIKAFNTDKTLQEEMVRKKLGWIKKDELLYKFIGPNNSSSR